MFYGTRKSQWDNYLANIYLFKVNKRSNKKICEIFSELTIKTTERRHWRRSGVFIVNFEHVSHLFTASIFDFEQLNVGWVELFYYYT